MRRTSARKTRSSGSVMEQINGDINPAVDKVSEQSNATVPSNATSKAVSDAENVEELPNNAIENGHLHDKVMENGNGESNEVSGVGQISTPVTVNKSSSAKSTFLGSHRKLVLGLPARGQFEIHRSRKSATSSKRVGGGGERKVLFPSHKRAQKSKETAASPSVAANSTPLVAANAAPVDGPKKRKKNKKKGTVEEDDEYTRIKKKLRYFLNRISYEQSLIDAYSLEGWKGSSAEKLRPEKELERAKKEILKRKVKIRDLFQHLDTLCAEGSLPEALFDSGGEIASEDIFCAKCGSKDLSADNDIILCDGFCDRGFHQYCVAPPLRKEDIPPDDEGWLCPGCDCKEDSLDLLNDSLGTKLLISDTWEKVFPEAAAALNGGDQNLNCDLPSDDSDDEEYNPDGLNDNENDEDGSDDNEGSENEDGSSDESDFSSASDEMLGSVKDANDIIMGLPSDDSEDDDYDPDAPADEDQIQDGSDSDCSSDSEDPETSFKGEESNQQDEVMLNGEPTKKSQLPNASISESDAELDQGLADVPARRKVERLDYKKLYDEEYDNAPTSSSDDEDWDKTAGKEDLESADELDTVPLKESSKEEVQTSTKKPRKNAKRTNRKDLDKIAVKDLESAVHMDTMPLEQSSKEDQTSAKKPRKNAKKTNKKDGDKTAGKEDLESAVEMDTVPVEQSSKEDQTSTEKPRKNAKRTNKKDNLTPPQERPEENGCSGEKGSSSTHKKSDPKTQRLFKTFHENRYPDKATRESLAKELQMTMKQVDNWFRNRRSSTSKPLVTMVSKEDVDKLRKGKEAEGETSVAGSSKQAMETETASGNNKRGALESITAGSRKRRR